MKPGNVLFETKPLNDGQMGAVLFVKENEYKRGLLICTLERVQKERMVSMDIQRT